jgi:hypothetical protein
MKQMNGKEVLMDRISCRFERLSNFSIALAFVAFGVLFILLGISVLPIFGFIIAVPALGAALMFFKAHRSEECSIGG